MKLRRLVLPLATATVLAAGVACTAGDRSGAPNSPPESARSAGTAPTSAGGAAVQGDATLAANIPELVESVRQSVVKVSVSAQAQSGVAGRAPAQQGTGTGFVIDDDGHIVTNHHVVTLDSGVAAGRIQVELWDGRVLDARVVGTDARTDLAVLKVEATGLRPLSFADPESIAVGQAVVAIGYALDLGATPTVTTGVISALDRVIEEDTTSIAGALQTDAAINPGNSGGPLLDLRGEVVGVNTAGIVGAGRTPVQGISFAVSAEVAEPVVAALIADGRVNRGFLGISAQDVNAEAARTRGLAEGAAVVQVTSGSPAERAGIRAGDVITAIGGTPVTGVGDITNALTRHPPGSRVPVTVARGSERLTLDVTLGAAG